MVSFARGYVQYCESLISRLRPSFLTCESACGVSHCCADCQGSRGLHDGLEPSSTWGRNRRQRRKTLWLRLGWSRHPERKGTKPEAIFGVARESWHRIGTRCRNRLISVSLLCHLCVTSVSPLCRRCVAEVSPRCRHLVVTLSPL